MSVAKFISSCFYKTAVILGLLFEFNASAQQWNTLTPLPDGYSGHSLVYYSNFLYQAGGYSTTDGGSDGDNVFYCPVNTNGTIGNWTPTTPLPDLVAFHGCVAANGFLYILGGQHFTDDGIMPSNTVYYAKINSDGSVGAWQTTVSLPRDLYYLSASVWSNTIYVAAGADFDTPYSNVYSAKIQSDGSLSAWSNQPSLPVITSSQAQAVNGFLYVIGGADYSGTLMNNVYYSKINGDGSLGSWKQTTPFPFPVGYGMGFSASGKVFLIGGTTDYNNPSSSYQQENFFYSANVMGDGTLGAWSSGTPLPQPLASQGLTANGSYIFNSGGVDFNGFYINQVYSIALPTLPVRPALTSQKLTNGNLQLQIISSTNTGFGILASTNLTTWTNIGWGFTGTNGVFNFMDTNAPTFSQRFYRAYWPLP